MGSRSDIDPEPSPSHTSTERKCSSYGDYQTGKWGFPGSAVVKKLPANAGDAEGLGLTSGLGRSPGEGNGNSLQYFCLENPMDRGAWQATVHGVAKCRTQLSTHVHIREKGKECQELRRKCHQPNQTTDAKV